MFNHLLKAQVNLQTGAAQFSIPLYSYADPANRISTGISLDYIDGNGLKVNEMASPVGTGWALNMGGVITRIRHGEADDQYNGGRYPWTINGNAYYPDGYLYTQYNPASLVDNGASHIALLSGPDEYRLRDQYLADREQDYFSFSFNGRTGEFVIGKDGSIRTIIDSRLLISKVETDMSTDGTRTRISQFDIVDENGIKYTFKDIEKSEVIQYDQVKDRNLYNAVDFNTKADAPGDQITLGTGLGQFIVDKWYLSEITNPLTNSKIKFQYEDYNIDINTSENLQKSAITGLAQPAQYSLYLLRTKAKDKRLVSIICSSKESVVFEYSSSFRADLPYEKALNNIKVLYNGAVKYAWNFSYGYFHYSSIVELDNNTVNTTDQRMSRLCLKAIQKSGQSGLSDLPYIFDYYLEHAVPAMFSYYHDHWGYSNASLWGTSDPWPETYNLYDEPNKMHYDYPINDPVAFRGIADGDAKNGILKTIHYPTGGTFTYEYEQNRSYDPSKQIDVSIGGVRVSKTTTYNGNDAQSNIITDYRYTNAAGASSGWGYEPYIYYQQSILHLIKSGNRYPAYQYFQNASMSPTLQVAGKVIQAIPTSIAGSSLSSNIIASIIKIVAFEAINILSDPTGDYTVKAWSSESFNGNNMLPTQYSRVVVTSGALNGESNGRIEYEFTSNADYSIYKANQTVPYSDAPRLAYWLYGLPKRVTVFNKDNVVVKKDSYTYQPYTVLVSDVNNVNQKWTAKRTEYYNLLNEPGSAGYDNITSEVYYPLTGRIELSSQETVYNNDVSTLTRTTYSYNPTNYLLNKTSLVNSNNDLYETYVYYPADYALAGPLQTMKDKNIINKPVYTITSIKKNGNYNIISAAVTEFGNIANGDIKPVKSYALQKADPWISATLPFNSNQLIPNSNYLVEMSSIGYNIAGLPVQTTTYGKSASRLYDYEGKYVIADISNASADQIAFTSFEGDSQGNWRYDNQNVSIADALTGKKSYLMQSYSSLSLLAPLDAPRKYILSFWSKVGAPVILTKTGTRPDGSGDYSGTGTKIKSYVNTANGWTYYEYVITGVANIYLDNGNLQKVFGGNYPNILLDELRLYPTNSSMITYTYDPMIGMTSQCNINNKITYYEYDGLGRLLEVRDQDGNIVKRNCYVYQNQGGCLIYYSDQQSKTYYRDCGSNSYGLPYTYTVPAKKYVSFISADDANAKAIFDRDNNGQNEANKYGSCLPKVYCRIEYTNSYTSGYYSYATPVIKFYTDQACSLPASITNIAVTYKVIRSVNGASTTIYTTSPITGNQYSLGNQVISYDNGNRTSYYEIDYSMVSGYEYFAVATK